MNKPRCPLLKLIEKYFVLFVLESLFFRITDGLPFFCKAGVPFIYLSYYTTQLLQVCLGYLIQVDSGQTSPNATLLGRFINVYNVYLCTRA